MTRTKLASGLTLALLSLFVVASPAPLESQGARSRVMIRTSKPYTNIESAIVRAGGRVTHRFRKIDLIAAEVTESGLRQLRGMLPDGAISKDEIVPAPAPVREVGDRGAGHAVDAATHEGAASLDAAGIQEIAREHPAAYTVNNAITGVDVLHGNGFDGAGMTVAVIDSGIRPGFPHLEIGGTSIVGCEDFVLDALGCSNFANNGHGTFVAGMISANVVFNFGTTSALRNGVLTYAPGAFSNPPTNTAIPMIGSAPLSGIYALRVFGQTGGSPTSRILQAMERAIELREQFEAGTGGADIQVVNMSLGGSTIFAGRDQFDRMVNELLFADIVPVIAASNNGPALVTTGSPGSALSALTVGAASFSHNERILRVAQNPAQPLTIGALYRPFNGTQTAYFSSRGPNADGRPDPDVMANGFANYGQGTGGTVNSVSLGSGTSYASPSVAGLAAILRQAFPSASALKIRNAIIAGADDTIITDGSSQYDQGQGVVNAVASYNLLLNNQVPHSINKPFRWWWLWWWFSRSVAFNLERAGLDVQHGNVSENSGLLRPGQHHSILYNVKPGTASVTIEVSNFQQTGPGNVLFGDDIILAVHSAKTSAIGDGDYPIFAFTQGGTFVLPDPEPGIMRITLYGDWTNSDTVSVDADVSSVMEGLPKISATGTLREGESHTYTLNVPAGTASLEFLLRWNSDWSRYPGADLDMLLTDPASAVNSAGATLNSPEKVTIANPAAGMWTIQVDGFEIHTHKEPYKLSVIRDGQVVKLKK